MPKRKSYNKCTKDEFRECTKEMEKCPPSQQLSTRFVILFVYFLFVYFILQNIYKRPTTVTRNFPLGVSRRVSVLSAASMLLLFLLLLLSSFIERCWRKPPQRTPHSLSPSSTVRPAHHHSVHPPLDVEDDSVTAFWNFVEIGNSYHLVKILK